MALQSGDFSDDSDFDEEKQEHLIRNFEEEGKQLARNLLPTKSRRVYELVYSSFLKWFDDNKAKEVTENLLLVYFNELSQNFSPSTLWSRWSILKSMLELRNGVNIVGFMKLKMFLKTFAVGYKPKQSRVFTWHQVKQFLDFSEDLTYLVAKVILIFGICGALRCQEFCNIKIDDIDDSGTQYIISINDTKNYVPRSFVIGPLFYSTVKKYAELRPTDIDTNRFFVNFQKGKCIRQVIGKNKFSEIPKTIACYLNLPESEKYTGHCFRRTAATLLSHSGANLVDVKSLGGWKSDSVAQRYIQNSTTNKRKIFDKIVSADVQPVRERVPLQQNMNYQNINSMRIDLPSTSNQSLITSTVSAQEAFKSATLFTLSPINKTNTASACAKKSSITATSIKPDVLEEINIDENQNINKDDFFDENGCFDMQLSEVVSHVEDKIGTSNHNLFIDKDSAAPDVTFKKRKVQEMNQSVHKQITIEDQVFEETNNSIRASGVVFKNNTFNHSTINIYLCKHDKHKV